MVTGRCVSALRCIESDRAVPPVVAKRVTGLRIDPFVLVLVELEDRHQLDAVHPYGLKIGDLFDDPLIGAGVPHL